MNSSAEVPLLLADHIQAYSRHVSRFLPESLGTSGCQTCVSSKVSTESYPGSLATLHSTRGRAERQMPVFSTPCNPQSVSCPSARPAYQTPLCDCLEWQGRGKDLRLRCWQMSRALLCGNLLPLLLTAEMGFLLSTTTHSVEKQKGSFMLGVHKFFPTYATNSH